MYLGLDFGSVSISAALVDSDKTILATYSCFHHGNIPDALSEIDNNIDMSRVQYIAVTGRPPRQFNTPWFSDSQITSLISVKERYPQAGAVLVVGGENFALYRFTDGEEYRDVRTSTSCAAGTGSFLDQQACRLQLSGSGELGSLAISNSLEPPKVATRCAVFAKTDLIHAQQEGYAISAIAEGLCTGLAQNLHSTLFIDKETISPVIFTGGVALNAAVAASMRELSGLEVLVDDQALCQGAIGAVYSLMEKSDMSAASFSETGVKDLWEIQSLDRSEFYEPLELKLSDYPDFSSLKQYREPISGRKGQPFVEVDLYKEFPDRWDAWLGFDIGSTSTKAVLCNISGDVMAGFYTRTAGRPVDAFQAVMEALDKLRISEDSMINILGSATTGSGRKFVGSIMGADQIIDEISAHARAAWQLNPDVDTIIEIGGQDAKFTTMYKGLVTQSIMNNVCAAGTGSFIEEQALRLNVDVRDIEKITEGVAAPLSSDRCTVFMERDINNLLADGCSREEVLASALHSVRENYLHKVAVEKNIGDVVFFQGATAKNKSLVAAFEQRLNKAILVSPFCHLTGALGVALFLMDEGVITETFRGIDIYKSSIPISNEVCELCRNHCKLTVADVNGETSAFGFLCGRDYKNQNYVENNLSGFSLISERNKVERTVLKTLQPLTSVDKIKPVIGLPFSLSLVSEHAFWKSFFTILGFTVKDSKGLKKAVTLGRSMTDAEFCASMTGLHGHVSHLLERADYVFYPIYMNREKSKDPDKDQYCYYSQYAATLVSSLDKERVLTPLVSYTYSDLKHLQELHSCLNSKSDLKVPFNHIVRAWRQSIALRDRIYSENRRIYTDNTGKSTEPEIVLLGRPYLVLPEDMNKGIPRILGELGIKTWYQDMIDDSTSTGIEPLLEEINWAHGRDVLKKAAKAAETEGLYPVLITSFKCGPDSFITDYFRQLMNEHRKPYLILELDEHDSSVGYETRIEAAIRSFRSDLKHKQKDHDFSADLLNPHYRRDLKDRTIYLPNWDELASPLLVTMMNKLGRKAVLLEETSRTIMQCLSHNNGQCLPLNAIAESFMYTVKKHGYDASRAVVWVPTANFSCNIQMYAHQIKAILDDAGSEYKETAVMKGEMSFSDIHALAPVDTYFIYMFSGLLRRMICRIRPYELTPGVTDRMTDQSMIILHELFGGERKNKMEAVQEIVALFKSIPCDYSFRKPQVAIFGDIYSRENRVMNQDASRFIEKNGGEVISMPFNQYMKLVSDTYFSRWMKEGKLVRTLGFLTLLSAMKFMEKSYYASFENLIEYPDYNYDEKPENILAQYNVRLEQSGESMENLLKTWYIKKYHPDVSLFIQLSPAYCNAALVTEAMGRQIEEVTGVPVLSITYDGTGGSRNNAIIPYLKYPRKKNIPVKVAETG